MKTIILAFILGSAGFSAALACDNPGTPNPVFAFATGPNTIQLKITNTATEGSEHTIWFLAQDRKGNVQRYTQGRILDGDYAVFNETNLKPNARYCFRIWTRVDTISGCESQNASGYVCANTQPPYENALNVSNNAKEDPSSTPAQPDQMLPPEGGSSGGGSGGGSGSGSNSGSGSGSGSGSSSGSGGISGTCIANGTGNKSAPISSTKDNQTCCNNVVGTCDNLCCTPGSLICPDTMHWYCSALR